MNELSSNDRHDSMENNSAYVAVVSSLREASDDYSFSVESNTSYGALIKKGCQNTTENIYAETTH